MARSVLEAGGQYACMDQFNSAPRYMNRYFPNHAAQSPVTITYQPGDISAPDCRLFATTSDKPGTKALGVPIHWIIDTMTTRGTPSLTDERQSTAEKGSVGIPRPFSSIPGIAVCAVLVILQRYGRHYSAA